VASVTRPALGSTQPPVQWVPGVLSPRLKRSRGVTLTTHPHLVPKLRMSRSYTFSPPNASVACGGTALAVTCLGKYNITLLQVYVIQARLVTGIHWQFKITIVSKAVTNS
jgi:hypothetical protein